MTEKNSKTKTPQLRFAGFTADWEEKRLGDVAEIVRGASPRPISDKKWFDDNSDIGWLRIADVTSQNGRVRFLEQHISKAGQEKTRVLTEPHLLLSIAATVGKPVINYVKTGVHDGFLIFQKPQFDIEYMFHWLEMFQEKWQRYGQPGSQVNLNSNLVKAQKIPLPALPEQQRIGALFQHVDSLITQQERKCTQLQTFKRAMLQQMFPQPGQAAPAVRFAGFTGPWEEKKLGNISTMNARIGWQNLRKSEFLDSGKYMLITGTDFKNGRVDYSHIHYVKKDRYDQDKKIQIKNDSILITKDGTIGKVALVRDLKAPATLNAGVYNIRVKNTKAVDVQYLFQYLRTPNLLKYASKQATGGTIKHLNQGILVNFKIPLPSLAEQQQIGAYFHQLDDLLARQRQRLTQLQHAKKYLLQNMFPQGK